MFSWAQNITHGPMIGGITSNQARIYIRTSIATPLVLEYSTDSTFLDFFQILTSTDEELDSTKIIEVDNLIPSTDYYFRFRINNNIQSVKGHFRTFPNEGEAVHLVFVTGSCQETPNMKVFDVMPKHHPDLFIHTGDFTYPSYQLPRYYGSNYPEDPNSIKLAWQKRNEEPICKDMLMKVPIDYMPDDDDTWGNSRYNKGGEAKIKTVNGKLINYIELLPRTQQMRDNCLEGYKNYFPGYVMQNDTDGYYHSFKAGNCEFFVIDVRSSNTGGWNNLHYDDRANWWSFDGYNRNQSILNQPQLNWLLSGLKNSSATWKFIVSGVPFNKNIQRLVEAPLLLQGAEFDIAGQQGTGFRMSYSFSDHFGAYAYERTKILNYIKSNDIKNVIVISGDTHGCAIDDGRNAGLPEMNASGLSVSSTELYFQFDNILSQLGFDLKRWLWNKGGMGIDNNNTKNAFGKIEVFGKDSVQLCIIDEDNTTIACHTILNNQINTSNGDVNIVNNLVNILPNPASQNIYIQLNSEYNNQNIKEIRIIDILGNIVFQKKYNTNSFPIEIPISDLANATYLIGIATDTNFGIQKFIKE